MDLSRPRDVQHLYEVEPIEESGLIVRPGEFVLASTIETLRVLPALCCRLDGRSTLARLGLTVHCTATVIDNNHHEHRSIVLEISNVGPMTIRVPYLHPVGMVVFERASAAVDPSDAQLQYAAQIGVTAPNLEFATSPFGID